MAVVDASVWVARLLRTDSFYEKSRDWLGKFFLKGGFLISPGLLLAEVSGALARRTGNPNLGQEALSLLMYLPGLQLVPIDPPLAESAAMLAADLRLRGADAFYVTVAYQLHIPLVTWDREQLERAGEIISTYTPEDMF